MSELIDIFIAVGDLDGEKTKYGYLHVNHEALLNPAHPSHEEVISAIGELAIRADHNGGLTNTETVWSYTLDTRTNEVIVENPYIKDIDHC